MKRKTILCLIVIAAVSASLLAGCGGGMTPAVVVATEYSIISREAPVETTAPKDWIFQGSNDNANWKTLDSRKGIKFAPIEKKTLAFSNTNPYRYYRLNVTSNGGNPNWLSITELEIMGPGGKKLGPAMTSNDTPSPYVCSASTEANADFAAWKAFDDSGGSAFASATGVTKGWLKFDFDKGSAK